MDTFCSGEHFDSETLTSRNGARINKNESKFMFPEPKRIPRNKILLNQIVSALRVSWRAHKVLIDKVCFDWKHLSIQEMFFCECG